MPANTWVDAAGGFPDPSSSTAFYDAMNALSQAVAAANPAYVAPTWAKPTTGSPLSAAWMNALEQRSAGAWPAAFRGFVTPYDYGAAGDGSTDDTAAMQAALDTGKTVVAVGRFLCADLSNVAGNALYGGGTNNSQIIAKPGTGTLYTAQQAAGLTIEGIWFRGNGNATVCVNTDWNRGTGAAPSLNNSYRNVRVSGYTSRGWSALSNNDCAFNAVLIEGAGVHLTTLDLRASGGAVHLTDCQFFGPMNLQCQIATITGCMLEGIVVFGLDFNVITGLGGYWYANPLNGCNIFIDSGGQLSAGATLTGVHLENGYSGGAVIGGQGKLWSTSVLTGCHVFKTGSDSGSRTIVGGQITTTSPAPGVALIGGLLQHVSPTSATAGINMHTQYVNVDGFYSNLT